MRVYRLNCNSKTAKRETGKTGNRQKVKRKYGYQLGREKKATETILRQAELVTGNFVKELHFSLLSLRHMER